MDRLDKTPYEDFGRALHSIWNSDFANEMALEKFGLKSFVAEFRAYLGVGFLLTIALTVVNSFSAAWKFSVAYVFAK